MNEFKPLTAKESCEKTDSAGDRIFQGARKYLFALIEGATDRGEYEISVHNDHCEEFLGELESLGYKLEYIDHCCVISWDV